MTFVNIPIKTNADADLEAFYAAMAERFPGWEPASGNLEVWLAYWWALAKVDLATLAADVPPEIFRRFGEVILGLPTIAAAPATAPTTWTMVDDAGHTIPQGTQVQIADGDDLYGFVTTQEIQVAAGDTETALGEVTISAIIEGEAANGLDTVPALIDSLAFVDSITLEAITANGVDAEGPDDYLDRLAGETRLLTPRPILPGDVETMARRIAGVARAAALDGYDAVAETEDNERTVTVAVVDEDGAALSAGIKTEVEELLEAERESNFVFYVIDPTSNTVKVDVDLVARPGAELAAVDAEVVAAITAYLHPANWGLPATNDDAPGGWRNQETVRRFELVALAENIDSVDYVTALTLALEAGVLGTSDVTLVGPAPLTEAGTITVDVS